MNSAERILVIEDDPAIRRGVVDALRFAGYCVKEAARGDDGLRAALTGEHHLVLLDLVLPGRDGMDVLEQLHRECPTLPVIVLTARGEEADRVGGLRRGADDYVVKPFSVNELLARVAAVLRRSPTRHEATPTIEIPGGRIDLQRREIGFTDGVRAELSQREAELLRYLAANRYRAVSREDILANVWKLVPRGITTRTIDMHIARLREKLRDNIGEPSILLTVRGKGYMFRAFEPAADAVAASPQRSGP